MPSIGKNTFESLIADQVQLDERINDLRSNPQQTLLVGKALLEFAAREDEAFAALSSLLDPAVQGEMCAEHEQIAEDLELLEWLLQTAPESPDVAVLTLSLIRRMRQHVDRDSRLLARAAGLKLRTIS